MPRIGRQTIELRSARDLLTKLITREEENRGYIIHWLRTAMARSPCYRFPIPVRERMDGIENWGIIPKHTLGMIAFWHRNGWIGDITAHNGLCTYLDRPRRHPADERQIDAVPAPQNLDRERWLDETPYIHDMIRRANPLTPPPIPQISHNIQLVGIIPGCIEDIRNLLHAGDTAMQRGRAGTHLQTAWFEDTPGPDALNELAERANTTVREEIAPPPEPPNTNHLADEFREMTGHEMSPVLRRIIEEGTQRLAEETERNQNTAQHAIRRAREAISAEEYYAPRDPREVRHIDETPMQVPHGHLPGNPYTAFFTIREDSDKEGIKRAHTLAAAHRAHIKEAQRQQLKVNGTVTGHSSNLAFVPTAIARARKRGLVIAYQQVPHAKRHGLAEQERNPDDTSRS